MSAWQALLARVRPHRRTLLVGGLFALLGAAAGLAQPLAAREVIEALAEDSSLATPLLVLGGLVLFSAVIVAAELWLLERTAERVVLDARRDLAARLLRLRLGAFDRQAPGDLVARATSDSTLLGSVASTALVQLLAGAVTLVAAVVLMGVVDLVLLGVTLAVLVVVGLCVSLMLPRILHATERQQEAVGALGAALERALGGLRTVKASGAEERETRAVTNAADAAYRRGMESAGYQAIVGTSTGLTVQVAFLAVLGVGGARVASGDMAVGDLIAFLLYLFYLTEPIASVAMGVTQLQQGLAAIKRIDEVATLPVEEDISRPAPLATVSGDGPLIRFERGAAAPAATAALGRGRLAARRGERDGAARRAGAGRRELCRAGDRPPPLDGGLGPPHRRAGGRPSAGGRHARRAGGLGRALRRARRHAVQRRLSDPAGGGRCSGWSIGWDKVVPMGERTSHPPGTFSWTDLATTDPDAAREFYTGLFGWAPDDRPIPGDGVYTMLLREGKEAAALSAGQPGMPPHWNSYVTVASVDETAAKAKELSGAVVAEPFDVMDAGRMAVLSDPTGAMFSIWEPRASIGAEVVNAPGAFTLSQLNTTDPERALEFYGGLFGWRGEPVVGGELPYWGVYNGDRLNAGLMLMPPGLGAPPHWLAYFGIESVDAAVGRLGELGGRVMVPPTDVPGGKILVAQDPQGAIFGLLSGRYDD